MLTGVYFIDQKTGWVTGAGGTLRQSGNGGESWTGRPVETQQPHYGIHFPSATDGWVVGGGGTILHTADGGAHWVEQASGTSASLYAVQFLDAQRGTAVGALGTVLATRDGGRTWVPQVSQGAVTLFDVTLPTNRPAGRSEMRERSFKQTTAEPNGWNARCPEGRPAPR